MKICIIGAGNAGCAHAFKLTEYGHEIRLVKTSHVLHNDYFDYISSRGCITAIDYTNNGIESTQSPTMITRDMKAGISGAEVVLVMTQSLQHDRLASILAPNLEDGQLLLIIPGNLGSMIFARHIKAEVIIGEGESTPVDARIEDDMRVHILFKNVRNALSFLPARATEEGIIIAKNILDTYGYRRKNVIESALHNPNLIVHTIGTIMSAARIEAMKGDFWMYRESFSPSVWNLVEQLDLEKNRTLQAYGGEPLSYLEACKFRNEEDLSRDALSVFQSYATNGGPQGPNSINTRFIYEDVPNGLCLLSSLAKKAEINTPVCDALIIMANSLMKINYWKTARTVERLGIADWSLEQICSYIETGKWV